MKVLTINNEEILNLLSMGECIDLMEDTFKTLAKGNSIQPLRTVVWHPEKKGLLGMMPGYEGEKQVMGIKVISVFPGNQSLGLSSHQGAVMLFDKENGQPQAIINAEEITAIRTAAVSALATKFLAKDSVNELAILGSGVQAAKHLEAILIVRDINSVKVWSRNYKNTHQFVSRESKRYKVGILAVNSRQEATENAEIICTTTGAKEPVLNGDWVRQGAHINAVGSCTPSARELDSSLMKISRLYTDSRESLFNEAGDFIIPKNEGLINEGHVVGELGELLLGKVNGRESVEEVTLFKSLGLAVEDLAAGNYIYNKALDQNIGTYVDLFHSPQLQPDHLPGG